jgi:16S rRNA (uracil1498-N3)-methyltransferase
MAPVYLQLSMDQVNGDLADITGPTFHHLIHVRRLVVGDLLHVVLPDGRGCAAVICSIGESSFTARLTSPWHTPAPPPCRLVVYQALLKGEKMDWVVQKTTELGASVFVPLVTRRSVPHLEGARAEERRGRWQRIADAAAAQCERPVPLEVVSLRTVEQAVGSLPALSILLHEREGHSFTAVAKTTPEAREIGLLIGPEGGWEADECAQLLAGGAQPVRLGGRILRAETAAIVALTLAQYLWGDLGGRSFEGE